MSSDEVTFGDLVPIFLICVIASSAILEILVAVAYAAAKLWPNHARRYEKDRMCSQASGSGWVGQPPSVLCRPPSVTDMDGCSVGSAAVVEASPKYPNATSWAF